ncbi:hypothetical protein G9O61_00g002820 [Vairimorpha ceranae]|nr:hypothetical protein G9O61_00g002820 [Vairimorpha ceranae]
MLILFLFSAIYSEELQFLVKGFGMYICTKDGYTLYGCSDKSYISKFLLEYDNNGKLFIISPKYNKIFDIANNESLILWPKHGGPNQVFELNWINNKEFMLMNREKCVVYNDVTNKFDYKDCKLGSERNKLFKVGPDEERPEQLTRPSLISPTHDNEHAEDDSCSCFDEPIRRKRRHRHHIDDPHYRRRGGHRHYRPMKR